MMRQPRTGLRIPVELTIDLRWKSRAGNYHQVRGKTGNVSGNGLFVAVPVRPRRATPITITVVLPKEVTRAPVELYCQGRVVRWSGTRELPGIGAVIDEYELRPARPPV